MNEQTPEQLTPSEIAALLEDSAHKVWAQDREFSDRLFAAAKSVAAAQPVAPEQAPEQYDFEPINTNELSKGNRLLPDNGGIMAKWYKRQLATYHELGVEGMANHEAAVNLISHVFRITKEYYTTPPPQQAHELAETIKQALNNLCSQLNAHNAINGSHEKTHSDYQTVCEAVQAIARLVALASPQVKGYSVDEVRQALEDYCGSRQVHEGAATHFINVIMGGLASLSAKGEAAVSGHELLTGAFLIGPNGPIPFDLAALLEKAQEGSYQHIGGIDQWKEAHDIVDLIEEIKTLPVAKGEAPKEDAVQIKCCECGKVVPDAQMAEGGGAVFHFTPDTHFGPERSEWECASCAAPEGTVSAPVEEREGARPPFEKFEDTDLVSIATVKGWFAAAKEGEQPEPAIDLFTLAEQVWQKLDGPKTKGDFLSWEHGFVTGHRMAAPKPNPEPLVAALKKTNKGLDVIVGSLAKNGQLASASLLAQLKHDNAATLTQWEASNK